MATSSGLPKYRHAAVLLLAACAGGGDLPDDTPTNDPLPWPDSPEVMVYDVEQQIKNGHLGGGNRQPFGVADLNGDGHTDLLFGTGNSYYPPDEPRNRDGLFQFDLGRIVWGPLRQATTSRDLLDIYDGRALFYGENSPPLAGDYDGDDVLDLMYEGVVFPGPFGLDSEVIYDNSQEGGPWRLTRPIDLDGDGDLEHIAIGSHDWDAKVQWFYGWEDLELLRSEPSWKLGYASAYGNNERPYPLGDWNGDGISDLGVGFVELCLSPFEPGGANDCRSALPDLQSTGGAWPVADVNADGAIDLLMLDSLSLEDPTLTDLRLAFSAGQVPPDWSSSETVTFEIDPLWQEQINTQQFFHDAGDFDGDGHADLWIVDTLFLGPFAKGSTLRRADGDIQIGDLTDDTFVFAGQDFDNDGYSDVIIDSFASEESWDKVLYVLWGRPR